MVSFPANDDHGDLYIRCDSKFPFHAAYTSTFLQLTVLLSMAGSYNALLDSGCTHHIIRDRSLFRDYLPKSISVGTANCGSLDALGSGDVEFRYPFGDRFIIFTLHGCLYAPAAPINLLSVGALVERVCPASFLLEESRRYSFLSITLSFRVWLSWLLFLIDSLFFI